MSADVFVGVRAALEAALAPALEAELVSTAELHLALALGRLGNERRAEVLALLALALAAPRRGDVGVSLADPLPEAIATLAPAALSDSPLVGQRGEEASHPFVLDHALLYTSRAFTDERSLAQGLLDRASAPLAALDEAAGHEILRRLFKEEADVGNPQALAVAVSLLRRLAVITGGPGTGKTYSIRMLLAARFELALKSGSPLPSVALAAPTGKAATRIKESLLEGVDKLPVSDATKNAIRELRAETLHKLLGVHPDRPARPRHHAGAPLPYDLLIVDETSMVDLSRMAQLVAAVRKDATLVLLGDPQQLPSVDAGAVLGDIVTRASSSVGSVGGLLDGEVTEVAEPLSACIVALTTARRFDSKSGVGEFASAIAQGSPEKALQVLERASDLSLASHGARGRLSDARLAELVEPYRAYYKLAKAGPARGEALEAHHRSLLEDFDKYRVLTVLRGTELGAEALSRDIAGRLVGSKSKANEAFVGKALLIQQNRYDLDLRNGDVGIIVRNEANAARVVFPAEAGGVRYLPLEWLPPSELAFAMTVHKSQGSQFPSVALVLPAAVTPILSAETVYTAVTRAKKTVRIYGERGLLQEALGTRVRRASGLPRLLAAQVSLDASE